MSISSFDDALAKIFPNFLAALVLLPITILEGNRLSCKALPSLRNSGEKIIFLVLWLLCSFSVCPIGNVDFITIGQYLPPTPKHAKLEKFITPKEFEEYKQMAIAKGFLMVSSSPLTRSSYHASEDFRVMQENRASKNY